MTPWWMEICAAPVAVGFAMVFNVPLRALPWCAALGVAGHAARWAVQQSGGDLVTGTLAGALLISVGALALARWRRSGAIMYSVAAAIPLVPGTALFHAVAGGLRLGAHPLDPASAALLADAAGHAAQAALLVLALAFGLAAPALVLPRRPEAAPGDEDDALAVDSGRLRPPSR